MKKAGISSRPTNMNNFWTAQDKLKASGVYPMSLMTGDINAWTSMLWFSHIAVPYGGPDVWDKPFTDQASVVAAKIMKRIFENYTTPDAVGAGAGVSGGHFLAGRTAIFANGPWYSGRADLRATPFFPSIDIAQAPSPYLTDPDNVAKLAATSGAVNGWYLAPTRRELAASRLRRGGSGASFRSACPW